MPEGPTPTRRTPLVDIHAHFLTGDYVAAAHAGGHVHPDGMPGWPAWSAEDHLTLMDQWDIAKAVLSISSPGVHFGDDAAARALARQVNDAGAAVVDAHPERFGHFASLPLPDVDGSLAEAAHALDELGSDGVTVETSTTGVYLGDPRYEPLWADLDARATVVFVHPTSPPCHQEVSLGRPRPMLEFLFESTRTVSDLLFSGALTRHPHIQWVIPHCGAALALVTDRMELFRQAIIGDDADMAPAPEQIRRLWFDMAGTPFPHQVPALVTAFGSDHLLYGSDYCWTPAPAATAQVSSLDDATQPPDDTWRALTTRNALRLLGDARTSTPG